MSKRRKNFPINKTKHDTHRLLSCIIWEDSWFYEELDTTWQTMSIMWEDTWQACTGGRNPSSWRKANTVTKSRTKSGAHNYHQVLQTKTNEFLRGIMGLVREAEGLVCNGYSKRGRSVLVECSVWSQCIDHIAGISDFVQKAIFPTLSLFTKDLRLFTSPTRFKHVHRWLYNTIRYLEEVCFRDFSRPIPRGKNVRG